MGKAHEESREERENTVSTIFYYFCKIVFGKPAVRIWITFLMTLKLAAEIGFLRFISNHFCLIYLRAASSNLAANKNCARQPSVSVTFFV